MNLSLPFPCIQTRKVPQTPSSPIFLMGPAQDEPQSTATADMEKLLEDLTYPAIEEDLADPWVHVEGNMILPVPGPVWRSTQLMQEKDSRDSGKLQPFIPSKTVPLTFHSAGLLQHKRERCSVPYSTSKCGAPLAPSNSSSSKNEGSNMSGPPSSSSTTSDLTKESIVITGRVDLSLEEAEPMNTEPEKLVLNHLHINSKIPSYEL